jgi:hypothetical protein
MVKLNRNNKLLRKTNKNFILFETKTNESFFFLKFLLVESNGVINLSEIFSYYVNLNNFYY